MIAKAIRNDQAYFYLISAASIAALGYFATTAGGMTVARFWFALPLAVAVLWAAFHKPVDEFARSSIIVFARLCGRFTTRAAGASMP